MPGEEVSLLISLEAHIFSGCVHVLQLVRDRRDGLRRHCPGVLWVLQRADHFNYANPIITELSPEGFAHNGIVP